jgi:hypothetical protein
VYVPCETSCIIENCTNKTWWPLWKDHLVSSSLIGGHFSVTFASLVAAQLQQQKNEIRGPGVEMLLGRTTPFHYILLVRSPVDRYISHYYHFIQFRAKQLTSRLAQEGADNQLSHEERIIAGWYKKSLSGVVGHVEDRDILWNITFETSSSLYVE